MQIKNIYKNIKQTFFTLSFWGIVGTIEIFFYWIIFLIRLDHNKMWKKWGAVLYFSDALYIIMVYCSAVVPKSVLNSPRHLFIVPFDDRTLLISSPAPGMWAHSTWEVATYLPDWCCILLLRPLRPQHSWYNRYTILSPWETWQSSWLRNMGSVPLDAQLRLSLRTFSTLAIDYLSRFKQYHLCYLKVCPKTWISLKCKYNKFAGNMDWHIFYWIVL